MRVRFRRQARDQHQQQRGGRHRQADDRHQPVTRGGVQQPGLRGFAEHHERELAAQRQHPAQQQRAAHVQPAGTQAKREQQREFHRQQQCHPGRDQQRLGGDPLQVDAHANRHEEQPEQQALERADLRFQFVPVFGFGQQHAGQERAKAGAQSRQLQQPGAAQHHQQRGGGEHFRHAGARDDAEQVAQQVAPAQHQRGDRQQRTGHVGHAQVGSAGLAEQRDRRQQRDRREVLEQQDRERQPPVFAAELLALGQQLQADRGRRQRQPGTDHQRGLPAHPAAQRQRRQHPAAQQHLQPAYAEDRPAHHRQPRQREFQADHEQQHHHADLAGRQHRFRIGDHPQRMRPQQHPGDQVTEHRAHPETLEHRHRDHRREQEHQRKFETAAVHAGSLHPGTASIRD